MFSLIPEDGYIIAVFTRYPDRHLTCKASTNFLDLHSLAPLSLLVRLIIK